MQFNGTYTFFFTDIQDSTKLWDKYPQAMQTALARHDAILRTAIEGNQGKVFKTGGDAFCAVFANAADGLLAALQAQQTLQAEPWGETVIKVRMGLHTGPAEERDNDYFGPSLNRVARIMSAGHGGQLLLSSATCELVKNSLTPGLTLRDMGEHSLKGLLHPEHLYQLVIPSLPNEFLPLKTEDTFRTNLPTQLTSFIGREKEIETVKSLLGEHRLVTLTGVGGTGKTRLSLQTAAGLRHVFPDGIWFVELAPLADPDLVPATVLSTLGLRDESSRSPLETLTHFLNTRKTLLILDNCEHLIHAAAQLTEALLQACANLHILASSREALDVPGEQTFPVRSLSTPRPDATENLENYEATRLFIERAKTVSPAFALTATNAPAIAQICVRLDGIPLAIELAAARVKMLKVEQIAERLDDRFRLLTGGSRTALPRQQTLRAMIDWSYDLLTEPERVLLRRLSVFAGGWTLEAAETVCQGPGIDDYNVLDPLANLVNKSLVVVDAEEETAETRYRLLETIRQYAREKLSESGEGAVVRDAHLQYSLGLAEKIKKGMNGPWPRVFIEQFERESDNFRGAFLWSISRAPQLGLQMICNLYEVFPYLPDGYEILDRFTNHPQNQTRTALRACALRMLSPIKNNIDLAKESLQIYKELDDQQGMAMTLGYISGFQTKSQTRLALLQESLRLFQIAHDQIGIMNSLYAIGLIIGLEVKDGVKAYSYINDGLAIAYKINHAFGIELGLTQLAQNAIMQGDYAVTREWLQKLMDRGQQSEHTRIEVHEFLGRISYWEEKYDEAKFWFEKALAIVKTKSWIKPYAWTIGWTYIFLGYTTLRQNDTLYARQLFVQANESFINGFGGNGLYVGFVCVLEGFASLFTFRGFYARALTLFSRADQARQDIGDSRPKDEQTEVDRDLATIRANLDEATFAAAQEAGRAMSMDEAIALALESTHA